MINIILDKEDFEQLPTTSAGFIATFSDNPGEGGVFPNFIGSNGYGDGSGDGSGMGGYSDGFGAGIGAGFCKGVGRGEGND